MLRNSKKVAKTEIKRQKPQAEAFKKDKLLKMRSYSCWSNYL